MYKKGEMVSLRKVYGETLAEIGAENKNIVVLDADLAKSTMTGLFAAKFPDRFFDIGIAEQDMICTAAGLANYGKIAFASSFAIFATGRAWEQIRNSICYPRLPVKIVATHAGVTVGPDGGSHQALEDIAIMRAIPNMRVIVPGDAYETASVIKRIAGYDDGPVYVRLGRDKAETVFDDTYQFSMGKGSILKNGTDLTIFTCGIMTGPALKAGHELEKKGINAAVVNMSSIKPIDADMIIKMAKKTGAFVTCEEHNVIGGLFSAVSEVSSRNCPVPIEPIAVNDVFGESGSPEELLGKHGLTMENIVEKAKAVLKRKSG